MSTRKRPKWCKCIENVDEQLHKQGYELVLALRFFVGEEGARAVLMTQKYAGFTGRRKPVTMVATFCPFCGSKYPDGGGK